MSENIDKKAEESTPVKPESTEPRSAEQNEHDGRYETVEPAVRDAVLTRDDHRCQLCGERGAGNGGQVKLQVHHIDRNPDHMDQHEMSNLTTLCRSCHSWTHQQTSQESTPVELTEADEQVLLPHDREILVVLDESGPAMASDVADALSVDLAVLSVRLRLWTLMGLDNTVDERERQIVDQSASSGKWGLTDQIADSARGHIPDDTQTLLQRAADERVRQALDRGIDRETVAEVFDIHARTTRNKEKRARAYDFPLDAVAATGGRPPTDDEDSAEAGAPTETKVGGGEQQERLTSLQSVSDGASEDESVNPQPVSELTADDDVVAVNGEGEAVREGIQRALDALNSVQDALGEE